MHRFLAFPCLVAILAGVATAAAPESLFVGDAPAGLLRPAADVHGFGAFAGLDERSDIVRARFVSFDDNAFVTPRNGAATSVTLNLFDNVTFDVVLDREEAGLNVDRVLVGHVDGAEFSHVVFVESDGRVWANIWTLDAGRYEIRNAGPGVHFVAQVEGRIAPCGTGEPGFEPRDVPGGREEPAPSDMGAPRDDGTLQDMLIMYTAAARAQAGGTANITNAMNGWVTQSNVYYSNSQINPRMRLVHLVETAYVEASAAQNSIVTDRDRFRLNNDGFMDDVHTLRNTFGADLCHLVSRSNSTSICGIAASLSINQALGFAVTRYVCGASTFAHEVGHNQGCAHDHPNAGGGGGAFCYSFGHRTGGNPQLITVMSYPPGSDIPYFSNPNLTVGGQVIGVPEVPGCSQATAADNSRSINGTAVNVSNYRQATIGNPAPSNFDLTNPADGSVGVSIQPLLQWNAAQFATEYDVTLSNEPDMTPVLWSVQNVLTTSALVPDGILDYCMTYYWTVVASGFGGSTPATPTPADFTTGLIGDINGDGTVDFPDLNFLLFQYGDTGLNDADLDGDFDVDFADLNLLLSNYNQTC